MNPYRKTAQVISCTKGKAIVSRFLWASSSSPSCSSSPITHLTARHPSDRHEDRRGADPSPASQCLERVTSGVEGQTGTSVPDDPVDVPGARVCLQSTNERRGVPRAAEGRNLRAGKVDSRREDAFASWEEARSFLLEADDRDGSLEQFSGRRVFLGRRTSKVSAGPSRVMAAFA